MLGGKKRQIPRTYLCIIFFLLCSNLAHGTPLQNCDRLSPSSLGAPFTIHALRLVQTSLLHLPPHVPCLLSDPYLLVSASTSLLAYLPLCFILAASLPFPFLFPFSLAFVQEFLNGSVKKKKAVCLALLFILRFRLNKV